MDGNGYWISPVGKIHLLKANHINFVGENPELFNLTRTDFLNYFSKFDEPINWEGKARKEMFEKFFQDGWIRITEKSISIWTIETWQFDLNTESNIRNWCEIIGQKGGKFNSKVLIINCLSSKTQLNFSIEDVLEKFD